MCMHLHTCSDVHTHVCEHRSTHLRTRTHTHTYLHLARAEVSVSTPAAGEAQPAKERRVSASCVDAAAAGGRRRTRPLTSLPRGTASTADLTAPPVRRCSDTGPHTLGQAPSPHLPRTGSPPGEPPALPAAGSRARPRGRSPRPPGIPRPRRPHRCGGSGRTRPPPSEGLSHVLVMSEASATAPGGHVSPPSAVSPTCRFGDRHSPAKRVRPNPFSQVRRKNTGVATRLPENSSRWCPEPPGRSRNPRADGGRREEGRNQRAGPPPPAALTGQRLLPLRRVPRSCCVCKSPGGRRKGSLSSG